MMAGSSQRAVAATVIDGEAAPTKARWAQVRALVSGDTVASLI